MYPFWRWVLDLLVSTAVLYRFSCWYMTRFFCHGKTLCFTMNFVYLFLFYQFTVLSSRAVDGHQMYFEGSVVGKASTVGIDISLTPPSILTGGQKCEIWHSFNITHLWAPAFEIQRDIRILKQKCNAAMIALCRGKVWWSWVHQTLRKRCQFCPTL